MSESDYQELDKYTRKVEGLIIENAQLKQKLAAIDPLLRRLVEAATTEDVEKARRDFDERCRELREGKALIKAISPYLDAGMSKINLIKQRTEEIRTRYLNATVTVKDPAERAKLIKDTWRELEPLSHEITALDVGQLHEKFSQYDNAVNNAKMRFDGAVAVFETDIARIRQLGGTAPLAILKDLHIQRMGTQSPFNNGGPIYTQHDAVVR